MDETQNRYNLLWYGTSWRKKTSYQQAEDFEVCA